MRSDSFPGSASVPAESTCRASPARNTCCRRTRSKSPPVRLSRCRTKASASAPEIRCGPAGKSAPEFLSLVACFRQTSTPPTALLISEKLSRLTSAKWSILTPVRSSTACRVARRPAVRADWSIFALSVSPAVALPPRLAGLRPPERGVDLALPAGHRDVAVARDGKRFHLVRAVRDPQHDEGVGEVVAVGAGPQLAQDVRRQRLALLVGRGSPGRRAGCRASRRRAAPPAWSRRRRRSRCRA